MERRWQRRARPLALAVGLAAALGAGAVAAEAQPWTPPACADPPALDGMAGGGIAAGGTWYRLDPVLDDTRALVGQSLATGLADGSRVRSIALDAESFAAGPFGAIVLAGTDDGHASVVRAIDVAAGCATTLATEGAVIRRATIDPGGRHLYEFRVDRRTRGDLGVWRRPLDGSSAPVVVLGPPPADERFGRTFTTELGWSVDGDRLVVTSCGELACRTRTLDPVSGDVTLVAEAGLGEVVGMAGEQLVAYEACHGLPCGLVAVDLADGDRTVLSDASGLAVLVDVAGGPVVVHEITADGRSLRTVGLDGRERGRGVLPHDGLRLLPSTARGAAGVTVPRGWIPLARAGHAVGPDRASAALRNATTGRIVPLEEVVR